MTDAPPTGSSATKSSGGSKIPLTIDDIIVDEKTVNTEADQSLALSDPSAGVPVQLQQGASELESFRFAFEYGYNNEAADYYEMEVTVPEGAQRFKADVGFLKGSASGNSVRLQFFRNAYSDDAQNRLKTIDVESARQVVAVDIDLAGVSTLVVRFTCTNRSGTWRVPDDEKPGFGFREPVFVS